MKNNSEPSPPLASQTLFRGLDVVDAVAAGCRTARQIADHTGLAFSTTHRLASALVQVRYLAFEPRQGYRLGTRLLELGFIAYQNTDITRIARISMERLAELTKDTIHLSQLDGDAVFYLDKIDGQRPINVNSRIGGRKPICITGVGKALILDETEEEWRARFDHDAQQNGIKIQWESWLDVMRVYAKGGYALDLEENAPNVCCAAAPIRDIRGHIVAAISVTVPTDYTNEAQLRTTIPLVQDAAASISQKLGGRPNIP